MYLALVLIAVSTFTSSTLRYLLRNLGHMCVAHRQLAARSGQSSMSKKAFHCFAGTSPDSAEIESGEIQSLREGEANDGA